MFLGMLVEKGALERDATGAGIRSQEKRSGRVFLHVTHGKSSFSLLQTIKKHADVILDTFFLIKQI